MKIALSGYGKMGREVEKIAISRGHEVLVAIDTSKDWESAGNLLGRCDVLIDFSVPESAAFAINRCFDLDLPVVSGTTGWNEELQKVIQRSINEKHAFFYAPNFSIGVNIFFEINRKLAHLLNHRNSYTASIHEIHHIHKKDAPSGTAIALADGIIEMNEAYKKWVPGTNAKTGELPVSSERTDEVPGTHLVKWTSDTDDIEIKHTAHSRQGFALGAVVAAEWLPGRKGFFGMTDLLANNQ